MISEERRRAGGLRTNSRASTVVPRLPPPGAGRLQPYPWLQAPPPMRGPTEKLPSPIPTPKASLTRKHAAMATHTAPMLLWEDMRCSTLPGVGSLDGMKGIVPDGSGLESMADPDASEVVGEGFGTDAQGFVATVAGGITDDG